MPFGTDFNSKKSILFRLWAPEACSVHLILEKDRLNLKISMNRRVDGWFELETDNAAVGDLYRYLVNNGMEVTDPAARFNPFDVHGPSMIMDPGHFEWLDSAWKGRPWPEAVIYEIHVGTFTPEGTFTALEQRLDYLSDLGVTAIELMPIADFPGLRNWGYDGVLPYAPDSSYGHPDDLKHLIQTCHQKGLMVLLDVVYNHFGPEGNYLSAYASSFFTERHKTPWGNAINFDGEGSRIVRDFFIHNALYWLEEFHFDGLRLDAVHSIADDSDPHILLEIANAVHKGPGRDRFCHLILENGQNMARYLVYDRCGEPQFYNAQWNDDWHHSIHVLATGEQDGYYSDYADKPSWYLGRCLAEGFGYQGEISAYHDKLQRGEPSSELPLRAFINFLQNHDQIGNRAFGERLCHLVEPEVMAALSAILLLAPSPPMLFMGEEFACRQPFLYFCDFEPELAKAVSHGRRQEFAGFIQFSGNRSENAIPDPSSPETYLRSKLDWRSLGSPELEKVLAEYRKLLRIRHHSIIPLLNQDLCCQSEFTLLGERGLSVEWRMANGAILRLMANLAPDNLDVRYFPKGEILYKAGEFPSRWSVIWTIEPIQVGTETG